MAGWSDTKTVGFREKKPRLDEEVAIYEFPPKEWVQIRLYGPITSFMQGWVEARNAKDSSKINKFPKMCLDYDRKKGDLTREICPYRKNGVYMPQRFLTNFIVRELVGEGRLRTPAKSELKPRQMIDGKYYIKDPNSKTATPVRAKDFPAGFKDQVVTNTDLYNKALKDKKVIKKDHPRIELNDPEMGVDILVMYDPDKAGPAKWNVQLEDKRPQPLKIKEKKYLIYDLENLKSLEPESQKEAEAEWENLKKRIIFKDKDGKIIKKTFDEPDDDDDTDLEEAKPKKKKLKSKLKSKRSDPPFDLEDKPKKKKLTSKTSTKSSKTKPKTKVKSSSSKLSASKKRAKAKQFDDLDDLDDLD